MPIRAKALAGERQCPLSGRSGGGTVSLMRTGGGNIGIRNGHVCPQPAPAANTGGGNGAGNGGGGELCFTNANGFEVCLRQ